LPALTPESLSQDKEKNKGKKKKHFHVKIDYSWCKGRGICIHFCPVKAYKPNLLGKPEVPDPDKCIGCKQCVIRCPDFAIEVYPREEV